MNPKSLLDFPDVAAGFRSEAPRVHFIRQAAASMSPAAAWEYLAYQFRGGRLSREQFVALLNEPRSQEPDEG